MHDRSTNIAIGQGQADQRKRQERITLAGKAGSSLGAVLQQPHQQAALVVLATKEHGRHLDVPLLSAWTKPIDGTIQSEMTKARQEIDE